MALFAARAETAAVGIIPRVTRKAGGGYFQGFVAGAVTGLAGEPLMRPGQLEMGSRIMVELPEFPAVGVVATGAILPHGALMNIIWAVAGDAILAGILEGIGHVAGFAGCARM